jgi:hypothetical protein
MSKKNPLVKFHEKAAEHHSGLAKGFSGLVSLFHRAAHYEDVAEECSKMAAHHQQLSESHAEMASASEKALADRLGKTLDPNYSGGRRVATQDPPESAYLRAVPRPGGPPLPGDAQRAAVAIDEFSGTVDTSKVNPHIEDLFKANA